MFLKTIGITLLIVIVIYYFILDMLMELPLIYMALVMAGLIIGAYAISSFIYIFIKRKKNNKK